MFFSHSFPFSSAYTHFNELIDTWTRHAQAIETQGRQKFSKKTKKSSFLVKSLSEKARVIGTASDTPEIRARLYKH